MKGLVPSVRRTAWLLLLIVPVLAAALFWNALLVRLGATIVASEPPQPVDLILVLGGDFLGPRLFKAAELARLHYAPLVLLSSPPYQGRPEGEWSIRLAESKGYPAQMFAIFAHDANSTREEALLVRSELQRRRATRVILVTADFHSRRASLVFRLACPNVRFISVPAPDPNYHPERWWTDASSRRLLFQEWTKIAGTVLLWPVFRK